MSSKWKLARVRQCAKCPWRVDVDPHEIPGYRTEWHCELKSTIAPPGLMGAPDADLRVMACHESPPDAPTYCVGWLHHQLGRGNNIPVRMQMLNCSNVGQLQVIGEQHECFEDTLPEDAWD